MGASEQAAWLAMWKHRTGEPEWSPRAPRAPNPWEKLRGPVERGYTRTGNFAYYQACSDSAFELAVQTYRARARMFGAQSRAFQEWVGAQDQVFRLCSNPDGAIPPVAPADLPELIRFDRDYQRAAALFHKHDFTAAASAFEAIARERRSPWRVWAPYLVGRSYLWDARQNENTSLYEPALRRAEAQFRKVLADPALASTHDAARMLVNRIVIRLRPAELAAELSRRVRDPRNAAMKGDLIELCQLIQDMKSLPAEDPMLDWISVFRGLRPMAFEAAMSHWRVGHAEPWLIAALAHAPVGTRHADALIAAARALPADAHGKPTAQYYAARLLVAGRRIDEARALLREMPPLLAELPSSRNRALALLLPHAASFDEFWALGAQVPAYIGYDTGWQVLPPWGWSQYQEDDKVVAPYVGQARLAPHAADLVNSKIPLERLSAEVSRGNLPANLRLQLLRVLWVRSVLLGRWPLALTIAGELAGADPVLKPDLERWAAIDDGPKRRNEALAILARNPGLSVHIFATEVRAKALAEPDRDGINWWWWREFDNHGREKVPAIPNPPSPLFLTRSEVEQAGREWRELLRLGHGVLYLGTETRRYTPNAYRQMRVAVKKIDWWWGYQHIDSDALNKVFP